jgi:hypothetical protein
MEIGFRERIVKEYYDWCELVTRVGDEGVKPKVSRFCVYKFTEETIKWTSG